MLQEIRYSWQDFDSDMRILSGKISESGSIPDFIIGIKRGGLLPSVKFSHILSVPLRVATIYKDNISIELEDISKSSNLLLVDEICDSGDTLQKMMSHLLSEGFLNVRSACLYYNIRQSFLVDYSARKIDRDKENRWIVFPWEN
jgi:hypoxanthine phosphoribosyltransferase